MSLPLDISGLIVGGLTVLRRVGSDKHAGAIWLCKCSCGNTRTASASQIKRGHAKSCGCALGKTNAIKHGHARRKRYSSLYYRWCGMFARCTNPKNPKYKQYGARGITVTRRWRTFENFLADMGEPPKGMTLDRVDNDAGYCKANCRWATSSQQMANRQRISIRHGGLRLTPQQWAARLGIHPATIYARLRRDLPIAEVLRTAISV